MVVYVKAMFFLNFDEAVEDCLSVKKSDQRHFLASSADALKFRKIIGTLQGFNFTTDFWLLY